MALVKTYTGLKAILKTKLEGILGGDSTKLLEAVYTQEETEITGYPSALITEFAGEGSILDTARNEREWQFQIQVLQSVGNNSSPEQASVIVLDAVDRILTSFDTDPQLIDSNGEMQVLKVRVLPLDFAVLNREKPLAIALLRVAVINTVSRTE